MYIYIHVPFCSSICNYCDFCKILYDKKYIKKYLFSLKEEIKERYGNEVVKTIYIGGGTPTSLDINELRNLLDITKIFKKDKKIEFTIESNVESLDELKISLLKEYGVNRVSLGVQSFHLNILKELGRSHDLNMVKEVVQNLKSAGIFNISMDYIYGVNDDIDIVARDMKTFLSLDIPHISCYSLIIEDGTKFGIDKREYIDDDKEREMYLKIEDILTSSSYYHYEISNYCKKGFESIHNLNYWNNGEYYGFGLGAVSYLDSVRISNTKNLSKYLEHQFLDNSIIEDRDVVISNEFILGLRKIKGINISDFNCKYDIDIRSLFDIKDLLEKGYLEVVDGYLRIPKKYIYVSNDILVHFL